MKKMTTLYLLALLVLLLVIFAFVWFKLLGNNIPFFATKGGTAYSSAYTVNDALLTNNADYANAAAFAAEGDYTQAIPEYQKALDASTDSIEQGQIAFKIAVSTEKSPQDGGYLAAIPLLKAIAANTAFPNITRAYAIQEMGQIFYNYGDPKVTSAIFSDAPYSTLSVVNDDSLSYRHLFDYAISFYPLAISEVRDADWYATQIYNSSQQSSAANRLDNATVTSYKQIITQDLAAAQTDMNRIKGNPNEQGYIPVVLQREASIFAKLKLSGDSSFGDPIATIQQVISLYAAENQPGIDGFARYYEAYYLTEFQGASAAKQIQDVLAPIYSTGNYAKTLTPTLYYSTADTLGMVDNLRVIAGYDPSFKSYLMTLGWTAQDFSK